jgi:hypothetical protein
VTIYGGDAAIGDDPKGGNLQSLLKARPWDLITLQQNSAQSWKPETFHPYFDDLVTLVRSLAPQAEIRLHQTWAYRSDSKALADWGIDDEVMHQCIDAAYKKLSQSFDFRILPSGPALYRARNQAGRRYVLDPNYNFNSPQAPALPRQEHNFSVGYHWAITDTPNGIPELRLDANHLNMRGHFLCSATWLEAITGVDARTLGFCPAGMSRADRDFLTEMAHQTVHGHGASAA